MEKRIKKIIDYYGCQGCSYCCKLNSISVSKKELQKIIKRAEKLGFELEEIERHLHYEDNQYLIKYPCFLLENNKCLIYDIRPTVCRLFPFQLIGPYLVMISSLPDGNFDD